MVNDEKTVTMNHESEKACSPIKMQYTEKNYLSIEPRETTYFADKLKPIDKSKGLGYETYRRDSNRGSRSNSPLEQFCANTQREKAAAAYAKALELNQDVKLKYKDHVRREFSSKIINPQDQQISTIKIKTNRDRGYSNLMPEASKTQQASNYSAIEIRKHL